jgi:hypothetical protein
MDKNEGVPGDLFTTVAEAVSSLTAPVQPRDLLAAINRAIDEHAETKKPLAEVVRRVDRNQIPEFLGKLSLGEPLTSNTIRLWQYEVDAEVAQTAKLPRKTKKAVQKRLKGEQLGQRELARLQAMRESERQGGY